VHPRRILTLTDPSRRFLGPALIAFGSALIAGNAYYVFTLTARGWGAPGSAPWAAVCGCGLFTLIQILHNYSACIAYDPGRTAGLRTAAAMTTALGDTATRAARPQAPHEVRWCDPCSAPKPARVHHCSVCNACVMKMDHHCPWVNNCVGARTYPYFVRMLAWLCIGCAFTAGAGLPHLLDTWAACSGSVGVPPAQVEASAAAVYGGIDRASPLAWLSRAAAGGANYFGGTDAWGCSRGFLLCYALAVALGVSLSLLFGWHVFLSSTGQTSLEYYRNSEAKGSEWLRGRVFRHPFDRGSRAANWEAVFGTAHPVAWLLPPSWIGLGPTRPMPGLGRAFPFCACFARSRAGYYSLLHRRMQDEDEGEAGGSGAADGGRAGSSLRNRVCAVASEGEEETLPRVEV
jgi:hypothetical protein